MQLLINLSAGETLYIKSLSEVSEGGFSFILYIGDGKDVVTYDGPPEYKQKCRKLAEFILTEFN